MNLVSNAIIILAVICLTISNAASVKAEIVSDCFCMDLYKPVCDTTGATYSNKCFFNCAKEDSIRFGGTEIALKDGSGEC